MQNLISRYRDRLNESSSGIKGLSGSRQKSLTNISNNNINNNNVNSSIIPKISSTQSLNLKTKIYSQLNNNLKESQLQQIQYKHQVNQSNVNQYNANQSNANQSNVNQSSSSQLPLQKVVISNTMSLPPQPHNISNTKQKHKDKSINNNNNQLNSIITNQQTNLKSSRKINQKLSNHQKLNHQKLNHQKQKSKSKKHSRTPKKIVIITPEMLNDSFSQSILDVFINDLKQKNISNNSTIALINKDNLKLKVKLLLDQYFNKRLQIFDKFKISNSITYAQQIQRSNRQMAQSYIVSHGYPLGLQGNAQSLINNNQKSSSVTQLPLKGQISSTVKSLPIDFERRFFETQKQKQYLQNKVQTLSKRIQSLTRQLQKYSKIQRLISNTIDSQQETRKQVSRLRKQLQVSELKNSQQQKIWRKQVVQMRQIINELKGELIKSIQKR